MQIDLDIRPFRYIKDEALKIYAKCGNMGFSQLSAYSGIPVIAIVEFCLEEHPDAKDLLKHRESLISFYGYSSIIK